jgi:hypothetical protein
MMIDDVQSEFDFNEVHSILVKAPVETAFDCMKAITPSEISGIMRLLIRLRTLPERMAGRKGIWLVPENPLLSQMAAGSFTLLAERAPREIVLGMLIPSKIGRVWRKASALEVRCADAEAYAAFEEPDYIRVVMNLSVDNTDVPDILSIRTETRCRALSSHALSDFTPYWRLIRPFSGLIRIVWLHGIKRKAEKYFESPRDK